MTAVLWSAVALLTAAPLGWPVAPLDGQHPIRGSFLDPRPDGFHIGVAISVRDDLPETGAPPGRTHRVYAVRPGTVVLPPDVARVGCVNRRVDVGALAYVHVDPIGTVVHGQAVAAGQQLGWTCRNLWPFADRLPPRIRAVRFFTAAATSWQLELGALVAPRPDALCGPTG